MSFLRISDHGVIWFSYISMQWKKVTNFIAEKDKLIMSLRTIFCNTFWLYLDIHLHTMLKKYVEWHVHVRHFNVCYNSTPFFRYDKSILWRQRRSVPLDTKIASRNSPCRQSTTRPVKDISSGWNVGYSHSQTRICISMFLCVILLCYDKKCWPLCECLL